MSAEVFQQYLALEKRLLAIQSQYPDVNVHPNFYEEQDISQELEQIWHHLKAEEQEVVVKEHHKRIGKFCEESDKEDQ